jgi:restriction system protein
MLNNKLPQYHELMNPVLDALHQLGGSGSIDEIAEVVIENSDFSDEIVNQMHNPDESNQTEIEYRLAWARTYLKKYEIINNSSRGIWALVPEKSDTKEVDPDQVVEKIREGFKKKKESQKNEDDTIDEDLPDEESSWYKKLHNVLTEKMFPDAFERLTKRILREAGFTQIEVTKRSRDGGIDGKGIMKINSFLSFHVVFQCKRYKETVSSNHVRDFRGAMIGRADKGLLITTGAFTRDAKKEAARDGAPPIDLVDGDQLAEKLKEFQLGIKTELIEQVEIDEDWFSQM